MKFPFKKLDKHHWWQCLGDLRIDLVVQYLLTVKENEDMELIIRKKISWDTSRMRRYFEGPVVDFVRDRYADTGDAVGKGVIREALKAKFLGFTEEHGLSTPVSTTSLTRPKWVEFLNDINAYCQSEFGCALPETDNADIGD